MHDLPLLIVQAMPVCEVAWCTIGPGAHGIVDDAGRALLTATIGLFDAAACECTCVPFVEFCPIDRYSVSFVEGGGVS